MFPRQFISKNDVAPGRDKQLSALLHKWPDIEPGTDFETGVMQRIAAGKKPGSRRLVRIETSRDILPSQPGKSRFS